MAPDSALFGRVVSNSRNSLGPATCLSLQKDLDVISPLAGGSGNDIANILTTMFPIDIGRRVLVPSLC